MVMFQSRAQSFINRFNCSYPLILPPMGGFAGPSLAGAVAKAGGLGFIGTDGQYLHRKLNFFPVGSIQQQFSHACQIAQDKSDSVGLGFTIKGQLDKFPTIIDQVRDLNPQNLWLSSGLMSEHSTGIDYSVYCRLVRKSFESQIDRVNLFVQVDYQIQ
jgi:hypothetical protein